MQLIERYNSKLEKVISDNTISNEIVSRAKFLIDYLFLDVAFEFDIKTLKGNIIFTYDGFLPGSCNEKRYINIEIINGSQLKFYYQASDDNKIYVKIDRIYEINKLPILKMIVSLINYDY